MMNRSYLFNQLEELANSNREKHDPELSTSDDEKLSEPAGEEQEVHSVPDLDCREVIQEDHPFLKYAVKLGYELPLAQDALSRLGAAATTDSLLKAVLYSYAALNPSKRSRNHRNRHHLNNRNGFNLNQYNHQHRNSSYPSYMVTQDSYQRFHGYHPDVVALKSALTTTSPVLLHQKPFMKPISPPGTINSGISPPNSLTSGISPPVSDLERLNVDAEPFQPFAYSLNASPDSC